MKKSSFAALTCSAGAFAYMLVGFLVQAMFEDAPWKDLLFVLGVAAAVAAVLGIIVYAIASSIFKKSGPAPAEPAYAPGRVAIAVAGIIVGAAAIGGGWLGYGRAAEQQASKAAVLAAAAARRAQLAAMTPEQRAAMAAQQQAQAATAAKAASESRAAAIAASAAKETAKAEETARLTRAAGGAALLKNSMKDPEAFSLTSLVVFPSGAACYEYRAKNGFGAIFPGSAVLSSKGKMLVHETDGNAFVRTWNKECTPAGGQDIVDMVKQLGIV
jgi:hypothetical protein